MASIRDVSVDPYFPGDLVPWHFVASIIVASFFASLMGTLLTVELLHHKRLGNNLISRLQIFGCALSMGLIGIWCMHFIGNRSIVLGDGADYLQMSYSPGYTFFSCVLPVIGLSFAFYIAELNFKSPALKSGLDLCSGVIAGLSIVGMHYIGNLGTTNYRLIYPARFIIAACIIAIGACIIALMMFFYFKERWISVFWKRLLCAVILAIAVSGMHFTASIGCSYELKRISHTTRSERDTAVIVAATMCGVATIFMLGVIFYSRSRDQLLANRAQQVMLACAFFDESGHIMVTNEGQLPSQKIAKRFSLQKFDDEFNTGHPLFHWIWKVSHDWQAVFDLIPRMRVHLRRHDPSSGRSHSKDAALNVLYEEESYADTTILFREAFCVASADLAGRLRCQLEQLGTIYDQVIGTGILPSTGFRKRQASLASINSATLLERGQLLFFTRTLTSEDTDLFKDLGYRFAPPTRVEAIIAKTMQIPPTSVSGHLSSLERYAFNTSETARPKEGTWLTCFSMLGRVRGHFDIQVRAMDQGSLPDVQLSSEPLSQYQINYLQQFNGWSAKRVADVMAAKQVKDFAIDGEESTIVDLWIKAISTLAHDLEPEWFEKLTFNSRPIHAHYGNVKSSSQAMILGFTRLVDIHSAQLQLPRNLTFVPLDFFRIRAAYYIGASDGGIFRRSVHNEFGPVLDSSPFGMEEQKLGARVMVSPAFMRRTHSMASEDSGVLKNTSTLSPLSEDEEDPFADHARPGAGSPRYFWGGILATTDTIITKTDKDDAVVEMTNMFEPHVSATATATTVAGFATGQQEAKTFADLLYEQAKQRSIQERTSSNASG